MLCACPDPVTCDRDPSVHPPIFHACTALPPGPGPLSPAAPLPAVAAVGLAWPATAPRSYMRWRVPALASLRFLLLALPYNFEEGLWDEVFPGASASHRLAWLLNLSNLAVGGCAPRGGIWHEIPLHETPGDG